MSFALAPEGKERAAFAFASMLAGSRSTQGDCREHVKAVTERLRRLAQAAPGEPIEAASEDSASMIDVVSEHARWIWLEASVVVENRTAGPQWFDNAFEVEWTPVNM